MNFAFELRQRVIVPNSNGLVQGVVVSALASVGAENQYVVSAMMDDGKTGTVGYGEGQLLAAQPRDVKAAAAAKPKR